jgi:hypothetical protein
MVLETDLDTDWTFHFLLVTKKKFMNRIGSILISLNNVQEQLKNPFDKVGKDDLNMNVDDETFMPD